MSQVDDETLMLAGLGAVVALGLGLGAVVVMRDRAAAAAAGAAPPPQPQPRRHPMPAMQVQPASPAVAPTATAAAPAGGVVVPPSGAPSGTSAAPAAGTTAQPVQQGVEAAPVSTAAPLTTAQQQALVSQVQNELNGALQLWIKVLDGASPAEVKAAEVQIAAWAQQQNDLKNNILNGISAAASIVGAIVPVVGLVIGLIAKALTYIPVAQVQAAGPVPGIVTVNTFHYRGFSLTWWASHITLPQSNKNLSPQALAALQAPALAPLHAAVDAKITALSAALGFDVGPYFPQDPPVPTGAAIPTPAELQPVRYLLEPLMGPGEEAPAPDIQGLTGVLQPSNIKVARNVGSASGGGGGPSTAPPNH